MSIRSDDGGDDRPDAGSFAGHGIPDGRVLLAGAARSIATPRGETVRVDDLALATVTAAFRESYAAAAGEEPPADVEAALADAVAWTRREDGGEELDVREELLPRFYRRLDAFHDAYHGAERPVVADDPS
ncbi:hypothetical protein [Halobaculum sp. EA56]|uniref:hypothetical protein n=1 Tax=Halobaculum sp. EA56 TaxID=3421648 RepID=UPI003EBAB62E